MLLLTIGYGLALAASISGVIFTGKNWRYTAMSWNIAAAILWVITLVQNLDKFDF